MCKTSFTILETGLDTELSILLRFYFHGVFEQLETNFQTNFRLKRFLGF